MNANILILGDICPAWGFRQQFSTGKPEHVFHDILPVINNADYVVANLEAPITNRSGQLSKNSICLKANPDDCRVLKEAGINAVSLANNHILDYQTNGLNDTIATLSEFGIDNYGSGNPEQAAKTWYTDISGKRIGFLAFAEREFNCNIDYGIGANLWDDLDGPKLISQAKKNCDYLIIQYHGGIEHYRYPSPYLQKKCRAMADAGADFVTCQHSHCVGTREEWNGCEILYGQGNCVFGYEKDNHAWNTGLIIRISFGDEVKISYIPIEARLDGEYLMKDTDAERLLNDFFEQSENLNNNELIKEKWMDFCKKQKDSYYPMLFAHGRIFNKTNRLTKGMLIQMVTKLSNRRNSMNIIRCDAHREVVLTIMEADYYGK